MLDVKSRPINHVQLITDMSLKVPFCLFFSTLVDRIFLRKTVLKHAEIGFAFLGREKSPFVDFFSIRTAAE